MAQITEPIFLVGAERSGSTLLRLMLDYHPEIAFNLESEYLVTRIAKDGTFPDMNLYRAWLRQDRVFRHSHFEIDEGLDYISLLNSFLAQKLLRDGKQHVGATVHHDFDKLALVWPKAKYIYLYRDGRDVANSICQMGWAGNVYVAAAQWLQAEAQWAAVKSKLSTERYIEVGYESLVTEPREWLARICAFLGVQYSERMFDYTRDTRYGVPDARLSQQWKSRMSVTDIRLIEAHVGAQLARRGYEPSGLPPLVLDPTRRALLRLGSRIGKLRHRLKRYGVALTLGEMAARRMRLAGWQHSPKLRIDAITDQGLR